MMRLRGIATVLAGAVLLAGCSTPSPAPIDAEFAVDADVFVVADVDGRAVVSGIDVAHKEVNELFDLGIPSADVSWARWSTSDEGAVLSIVRDGAGMRHYLVDAKRGKMVSLGDESPAGDAAAVGDSIWEVGPGNTWRVVGITDPEAATGTLSFDLPMRLVTSNNLAFVLGNNDQSAPTVDALADDGHVSRSVVLPGGGLITDVAADDDALYLGVIPDGLGPTTDDPSRVVRVDTSGAEISLGEWDGPRLLSILEPGVIAIDDTRSDGRFIAVIDDTGRALWTQKLSSAEPVVGLRYLASQQVLVVAQTDAISAVTQSGVESIPLENKILSDW